MKGEPRSGVNVADFKANYKTALETKFPDGFTMNFGGKERRYVRSRIPTRYGTNPNQPFSLYVPENNNGLPFAGMNVIKEGKGGFSLTNLEDISWALNILKYFDKSACAVMKHLNPCGFQVSSSMPQKDIYISARDCDPRSAFGSVTAYTKIVDEETALENMGLFTEVIVAPGFTLGALDVLTRQGKYSELKGNKDIRIVQYDCGALSKMPKFDGDDISNHLNIKVMLDGSMGIEAPFLTSLKSIDDLIIHPEVHDKNGNVLAVGEHAPTDQQLEDALDSWYVNLNVRSNGVVIFGNGRAISVGTGQQERIGAVEQAFQKALQKGHRDSLEGAVLSSDAFFPSQDCIIEAGKYGIGAVIWPAGSMGDAKVIEEANRQRIAMIVTPNGERCFSHH